MPNLKEYGYFLNHWQIEPAMPIVVLFIIYSSLIVYFVCEWCHLRSIFGWKTSLALPVMAFMFGYSYVLVILVGPGYLPFYYPLENPNRRDDVTYDLSGLVTSTGQLFYVKNLALPRRTRYFKTARRIVIRSDHFCDWTMTFIGKKNHKLFFLFNFWGLCYTSVFTVTSGISAYGLLALDNYIASIIFSMFYTILGFAFAILTGSFVFDMLCQISANVTAFESMKGRKNVYSKGCLENWEEVFGPRAKWYEWLLPIPAFSMTDDAQLIDDQTFAEGEAFL